MLFHNIEKLFYYEEIETEFVRGDKFYVIDNLKSLVARVEKRSKKRLLPSRWPNMVLETYARSEHGIFVIGRVCQSYGFMASVSFLYAVWSGNYARATAFRDETWGIPYGRGPEMYWEPLDAETAFKLVFPEEYDEKMIRQTRTALKRLKLPIPREAFRICEVWEGTPAALVQTGGRKNPYPVRAFLIFPNLIKNVILTHENATIIKQFKQVWRLEPKPNTPWAELESEILLRELAL